MAQTLATAAKSSSCLWEWDEIEVSAPAFKGIRDERPKHLSVAGLAELLRVLPSLGPDAEDFAKDVDSLRKLSGYENNPWD